MNIWWPVIRRPTGRHLDQLAPLGFQNIRHVVAHQRGIIQEPFLHQEIGGIVRKIIEGRTIAARPFPRVFDNRVD